MRRQNEEAKAGAFAYIGGKPPSLFELRRVRQSGKGRAIAKRRRIPRLAASRRHRFVFTSHTVWFDDRNRVERHHPIVPSIRPNLEEV